MLGISALMALSDAIAQARPDNAYPDLDSPATPERVLMAVEREGQK
jgi:xanthine dehydrogenase large subunit